MYITGALVAFHHEVYTKDSHNAIASIFTTYRTFLKTPLYGHSLNTDDIITVSLVYGERPHIFSKFNTLKSDCQEISTIEW